jgi:hypothetical protein
MQSGIGKHVEKNKAFIHEAFLSFFFMIKYFNIKLVHCQVAKSMKKYLKQMPVDISIKLVYYDASLIRSIFFCSTNGFRAR